MPRTNESPPRLAPSIPPGFDFPANRNRLELLRDWCDVAGMRRHAWQVFAGMTRKVADGHALFETWYNTDETFKVPNPSFGVSALTGRRPEGIHRSRFVLEPSREHLIGTKDSLGWQPPLISVLFSPAAFDFIRSRKLFDQDVRDAFKLTLAGDIECFPCDAVAVKVVWWPVLEKGVSVVPVWSTRYLRDPSWGKGNLDNPVGNDFTTWGRIVAVDPDLESVGPHDTVDVRYFHPKTREKVAYPNTRLVPFSAFHRHQLTQENINDLVKAGNLQYLSAVTKAIYCDTRSVKKGDYLVIVAIHIATKELEDWTWTTLWWDDKPEGTQPNDRDPRVTDEWQNFVMDCTFSVDTPKERDGSFNITFNPWLEAPLSRGILSNCAACHQRSLWTPVDNDTRNMTRGPLDRKSDVYRNRMGLDYLWSLTRIDRPPSLPSRDTSN